jgi:FkbM family methyltransferase
MVKRLLKKMLAKAGYEIRNKRYKDIFTIRQTMLEAFEHIKSVGFYPDLVIDIGAADGTPSLQSAFGDSNYFWVEPLEEFRPALENLKKKLTGNYLIAAMGKEDGEMEIFIQKDKVGSSLLSGIENRDNGKINRKIPVFALKNIAIEKFMNYSRILLKVDVQGFELQVLEGTGDFLEKIEVIILEVSLFNFLKDMPDIFDVVDYMKKKGFVIYDIVEGINRPHDMALGQKDLIFVKESGIFRQSHSWN